MDIRAALKKNQEVRIAIEEGVKNISDTLEKRRLHFNLSSEILSLLKIKKDEYFSSEKLEEYIKENQAAADVQAEALLIETDISSIHLAIQQQTSSLIQTLEDEVSPAMEVEIAFPNQDKNILQTLKARLLNWLMQIGMHPQEALSFDDILLSITEKLQDETIIHDFQTLLSEPVSNEIASSMGTYVNLKDKTIIVPGYIYNGRKQKFYACYSELGMELIKNVQLDEAHTECIEKLDKIFKEQSDNLNEFKNKLANNEDKLNQVKNEISQYFSKSIESAIKILKELTEIKDTIENQIKLADTSGDYFDQIDPCCASLENCATVAKKIVEEVTKIHGENVVKFGHAKIWDRLDHRIKAAENQIERLSVTKNNLIARKEILSESIQKAKLLEQKNQQSKESSQPCTVPEKPKIPASLPLPDEDEVAVRFYYSQTLVYSRDLSSNIKKHLVKLKKTPLWNILNLPESIDLAINVLKDIYDTKNDGHLNFIRQRHTINETLGATHIELKEGLEKYGAVVTKLFVALGEPSVPGNYAARRAGFFSVLRDRDTQQLIQKHRDNGRFIHFIRECGINVTSVFSAILKRPVGVTLFSPRSAQFSYAIEREEAVRQAKRPRVE